MISHQEAARRARELTAKMTVEERASQLRYDAPAIERLGIPSYNWWNEALHGVARAGTATVFPQAIGMAAAFDEVMQQQIGDLISTEARAKYNAARAHGDRDIYKGLTVWSPNINIFRDPRWGRGQETYGEDPYLTARLAVRFVRGLQGNGKYLKTAACLKHMAVHSGPEKTRHEDDMRVSDKDLYETYLPAFEAGVREGDAEAVMGAYNRVNGEPACGSKRLLTDILRTDWGFEGHVVSDCGAIADFHTHHHITDTAPESAALALKSGCDLNCGSTYLHVLQALAEGLIEESDITRACERVMASRIRLGMMDEDCEYDRISLDVCDTEEGQALSLRAARESMVLLRNDGILPLRAQALNTVAVIGPNADSRNALLGNYCGTSSRLVTFLQGIQQKLAGRARVVYAEGCQLIKDSSSSLCMKDDRIAEAVALCEMADVAIVCVGRDASIEGEGGDVSNEFAADDNLSRGLPSSQQRLMAALAKTGKPMVVVCASGTPVYIPEGNALLQAWYPGQAGGLALADILFGDVSPSGRLPVTAYRSTADLPDYKDYAMKNRTYRYFTGTPDFPFGHGLSYARFQYKNLRVQGRELLVDIVNESEIEADEVTLAYVHADSPLSPPNPSLCGFCRTHFQPGERRTVHIPIADAALTVVNEAGKRVRPGGEYAFHVGGLRTQTAFNE